MTTANAKQSIANRFRETKNISENGRPGLLLKKSRKLRKLMISVLGTHAKKFLTNILKWNMPDAEKSVCKTINLDSSHSHFNKKYNGYQKGKQQ